MAQAEAGQARSSSWSAGSPSRAARGQASARCCWACRRPAGVCVTSATSGGGFSDEELERVARHARGARDHGLPFETASAGQREAALGAAGCWSRRCSSRVDRRRALRAAGLSRPARRRAGAEVRSKPRRRHASRPRRSRRPPSAEAADAVGRRAADRAELGAHVGDLDALAERGGGRLELPGGAASSSRTSASRCGRGWASPRAICSATTWTVSPSCCRSCAIGRWS